MLVGLGLPATGYASVAQTEVIVMKFVQPIT